MPTRSLDPYRRLLAFRAQYPTMTAAAAAFGISRAYLIDLLQKRRDPSPRVLKALGLERVVTYRER